VNSPLVTRRSNVILSLMLKWAKTSGRKHDSLQMVIKLKLHQLSLILLFVSCDSVCIAFLIATLNDLQLLACDIQMLISL
jgi:hypothetical protein